MTGRLLVLKPKKEFVVLRKARILHVCHECSQAIPKGVYYVEDHINYLQRTREGKCWKKWYVNKICLLCWRGPLPKL